MGHFKDHKSQKKRQDSKERAAVRQQQPSPATPEREATTAQRALERGEQVQPAALKALQRTAGNRAVMRLVQTKLQVGSAGDRYEQEADRVAEQVVRMPTPASPQVQRQGEEEELQMKPLAASISPVQRQAEEEELQMKAPAGGGFEAGQEVEEALASRQGSGHPLPGETRAYMEPRFGARFDGVKVHTGGTAHQLTTQLQAKAFTHGRDIYFSRGAYDPHTAAGKQLLAHELTHTIQQTGQRARRTQISRMPNRQVQRLISRENFVRLAGDVSKKGKFNKSLYSQILQTLKDYEDRAGDQRAQRDALIDIVGLSRRWLSKHQELIVTGEGQYTRAKRKEDLRKEMFLRGLKKEAEAELKNKPLPNDSPSNAIALYDRDAQNAQNLMERTERGMNPTRSQISSMAPNAARYEVSVLAAIEHPDYLDFAKKRLELTVAQKKKLFKKNKKSNREIKMEAARRVVEEKHGDLNTEQKLQKIEELQSIGGEVGHAWVKLSTYDADDKKLEEHSFGFWPLAYFPHPDQAVPGRVRYPDRVHDDDAMLRRKDYTVDAEQYQKAMKRATDRMQAPPNYKLIDYNCTKFARDVAQAAEVNFPERAYLRIPLRGVAWDPNSLYHELDADTEGYNPQEEKQRVEQERQQLLERLDDLELELHNANASQLTEQTVERVLTAYSLFREMQRAQEGLEEILFPTGNEGDTLEIHYTGDGMPYKMKRAEYEAFKREMETVLQSAVFQN